MKEWEACELRYVAEGKLNRLSDEDLVELERLLIARLGNEPPAKPGAPEGVDRAAVISRIMVLKSELALKRSAEAAEAAKTTARQAHEEEPSVEEREALRVLAEEAKPAPHEEHDAQQAKPTEEELHDMKERMAALVQLTAAANLQPLPPEDVQALPATAATAAAIIAEACTCPEVAAHCRLLLATCTRAVAATAQTGAR